MESIQHKQLAQALLGQGRFEEALAAVDQATKIWQESGRRGDCIECDWMRLAIYIEWGRRGEVEDQIQELLSQPVMPWTAVALGDTQQALAGLEARYEQHNNYMMFLKGPEFDDLRDNPRFKRLYDLMNFPQ